MPKLTRFSAVWPARCDREYVRRTNFPPPLEPAPPPPERAAEWSVSRSASRVLDAEVKMIPWGLGGIMAVRLCVERKDEALDLMDEARISGPVPDIELMEA